LVYGNQPAFKAKYALNEMNKGSKLCYRL